jgi:hypothetical protein
MLSRRLTPRAGLPVFYVVRAYTVPANSQVPRKKKVWNSLDEAVSVVKSGDVLLSGGTLLLFNSNPRLLNAISQALAFVGHQVGDVAGFT